MSNRRKLLSLVLALAIASDVAPAQEEHPQVFEPVRLAPKLWNSDGTILCFPKCTPPGPCC